MEINVVIVVKFKGMTQRLGFYSIGHAQLWLDENTTAELISIQV